MVPGTQREGMCFRIFPLATVGKMTWVREGGRAERSCCRVQVRDNNTRVGVVEGCGWTERC